MALLGERLAGERLDRNLTQADLAREAGVSASTIKRLEAGRSTQLANLIRVLRALGLQANLAALVPSPEVRPVQALERREDLRRRATGRRAEPPAAEGWTWGDER